MRNPILWIQETVKKRRFKDQEPELRVEKKQKLGKQSQSEQILWRRKLKTKVIHSGGLIQEIRYGCDDGEGGGTPKRACYNEKETATIMVILWSQRTGEVMNDMHILDEQE